jgi:hypothetical protein
VGDLGVTSCVADLAGLVVAAGVVDTIRELVLSVC